MGPRHVSTPTVTPKWLAVGIVAGTILVASVVRPPAGPPTTGPLGPLGTDTALHVGSYAVLAVTLVAALSDGTTDQVALTAFFLATAFGLFVEGVQFPIPYRTFSLADLAADALGSALVTVAWHARSQWLDSQSVQ